MSTPPCCSCHPTTSTPPARVLPYWLAARLACRWGAFSVADLQRVAVGFLGLRWLPPDAAWLRGLTAAAELVLGQQQQDEAAADGTTGEEGKRLLRALQDLELLSRPAGSAGEPMLTAAAAMTAGPPRSPAA